ETIRTRVQDCFEQIITAPGEDAGSADVPDLQGLIGVWLPDLSEQEVVQRLTDAGFSSPQSAWQNLQDFRQGYAYRTMGQQGRERMNRLMPLLLGALYSVDDMDVTLMRVIHLLERIAGRTTYLSLLIENPLSLVQLVRLLGASSWVAELLALHPALLDEIYDPTESRVELSREDLEQQLSARMSYVGKEDLEQQMEALHHFKDSVVLGVAAASITNGLTADDVGEQLAACADVCLDQALVLVRTYLLKRHGMPCGDNWPGFAVIAYGKLGGQELNYSSDLDLVFLHGCEQEGVITRGPKKIPADTFFARFGQRFIHMLNQPTATGILYEVDMRLRPSGNSGLLVQSLESFREYQQQEAWVWEHQALVKARAVAGDDEICRRFEAVRHDILCQPRDPLKLRNEVVSMRKRMRKELLKHRAGLFDLKQGSGGLVDIEFMVQYAVLRCAEQYPQLTRHTDNIAVLAELSDNGLIEAAVASGLIDAYRYYLQRIQSLTLDGQRTQVDAEHDRDVRQYVAGIWEHWFDLYLC
ncbi:MAG: bifunctional [glutamate--ammonia ligase]-adenylyl-L-tyrosine phosphorylase/[glutamate--ammonia-ligase] adenylyltransferase, partial [Gammaproteobacteria bacterium]